MGDMHPLRRYVDVCAHCHKRSYTSRRLAKAAARALHDSGLREFRCHFDEKVWHFGHLTVRRKAG